VCYSVCWRQWRLSSVAGGVESGGGARDDALYATLLPALLKVLEVPEVMRCVLLCTLEAVEGGLCRYAGGY
jgi:hypothetical protein